MPPPKPPPIIASHSADGPTPPHSATVSTFSKSRSTIRSSHAQLPSGTRTVVTAPPWARDEPPSPYDQETAGAAHSKEHLSEQPRPSDVASSQSSYAPEDQFEGPSRWWAFTRHRPQDSASTPLTTRFPKTPTLRDRSLSIAWLTYPIHRRSQDDTQTSQEKDIEAPRPSQHDTEAHDRGFHLDLPPPDPLTISQNQTPGWDSPWAPRAPAELVARITGNAANGDAGHNVETSSEENDEKLSRWARRRKRFRVYILTNTYVPLIFRFVNITFTTAALAMAIRIRAREKHYHAMGAVGSSPTLVIIFAPLTLVHVMAAIYLEYFGRPLGLWRTSGKLAHTLSEVVFICAWSAALALCFDNFFTSTIPCARPGQISWYNELPRPPPIPNLNAHDGDSICDEQLALICLVGVGLIMYCYNLVISLFRIFEKVKYHPASYPVL
ncbi:hypothetical protein C8Q75DRAFT_734297 [Abortiporus biennis]|nr:hypothetical protein C8Q75DRAFT_734297 [Abortiporus biennis]